MKDVGEVQSAVASALFFSIVCWEQHWRHQPTHLTVRKTGFTIGCQLGYAQQVVERRTLNK